MCDLLQEVRDSQAAAEAAAAEGDRLRALADKVAAAAAEEKRGLAASTESMKRVILRVLSYALDFCHSVR